MGLYGRYCCGKVWGFSLGLGWKNKGTQYKGFKIITEHDIIINKERGVEEEDGDDEDLMVAI